jgi:hypothetical protein
MMVEMYVMLCKALVFMHYLYLQRFEISCCFYIQGMIYAEYYFKTERLKTSR